MIDSDRQCESMIDGWVDGWMNGWILNKFIKRTSSKESYALELDYTFSVVCIADIADVCV